MVNHCFCVGAALGEMKEKLESKRYQDIIDLVSKVYALIDEAKQCNYKVIPGAEEKLKAAEADHDITAFAEIALRIFSTDDCFMKYDKIFGTINDYD